MSLLLSILLGVAGVAVAAEHTVEVSVSKGPATFSHRMTMEEGTQASFVGPVASRGQKRQMVFNTLWVKGPSNSLQYQLEVSQPGPNGATFQVQGEVELSGAPVRSVECDGWTITLKEAGAKAAVSSRNYRVGLDVRRPEGKAACKQVLRQGAQGNVVSGGSRDGKRFGLIFNAILAQAEKTLDLMYQLEFSPKGATSLQLQNNVNLVLGKPHVERNSGYQLQVLVDKP